jgi:hypothetical protein
MALATRKSKGPKTPLNVNILQTRQIFSQRMVERPELPGRF